MTKGRIHSIESFGASDGPGIRYIVFFQGCPLRCLYCHNPDTREPGEGTLTGASELVEDILSYRNFISRGGGVTLSGGEVMMQREFALEILELCRKNGIHTALDTSGCFPLSESRTLIDAADMLLLDIKTLDPALGRRMCGMDIENPLSVLRYCESVQKRVWIRHVLVPGLTQNEESLRRLAMFLRVFKCVERVELLGFHKIGEHKWRELKWDYSLYNTPETTPDELEAARKFFDSHFGRNTMPL